MNVVVPFPSESIALNSAGQVLLGSRDDERLQRPGLHRHGGPREPTLLDAARHELLHRRVLEQPLRARLLRRLAQGRVGNVRDYVYSNSELERIFFAFIIF